MKSNHNYNKGDICQIDDDTSQSNNNNSNSNNNWNGEIYFWEQNQSDLENLCMCCGKLLNNGLGQKLTDLMEYQWYCGMECNKFHFIYQGGWLWRAMNPTYSNKSGSGNKQMNKLRHTMKSYFQENGDLFFTTTKLLGCLISRAINSFALLQQTGSVDVDAFSHHFRNTFMRFFQTFDHPSLISHKGIGECDESLTESHTLLLAMLRSEKLPPMEQVLTGMEESMCDDMRQSYLHAIREVFTLPLWAKILQIVDYFSLTLYAESDFLRRAQQLPLLPTYEMRKKHLEEEFQPFVIPSSQFLLQSLLENHEIGDDEKDEERRIEFDRRLVRIAQAAELANKPNMNLGQQRSTSAQCGYNNPFDGYGHVVTVLSSLFVPASRSDQADSRISQNCLPNIHVDVVIRPNVHCSDNNCPLSLQLIANRNIEIGDELTYDFSKVDNHNNNERRMQSKGTIHLGTHSYLFNTVSDQSHSSDVGNVQLSDCFCGCNKCALEMDTSVTLQTFGIEDAVSTELLFPSSMIENADDSVAKKRKLSEVFKSNVEIKSSCQGNDHNNKRCLLEKLSSLTIIHHALDKLHSLISHPFGASFMETSFPNHVKLRKLRDLADYYMQQQRVATGTMLYTMLLLQVLHAEPHDCHPLSTSEDCLWIGDVCLSLASIGFETLLSTHLQSVEFLHSEHQSYGVKSMWTFEKLKSIYELGLRFAPQHEVLKDIVCKLHCFSPLFCLSSVSNTPIPHCSLNLNAFSIPSFNFQCLLKEKIFITTMAALSHEECDYLIQSAENYATQTNDGWSTSRHYTVPTTDIPLHHLSPVICNWFVEEIMTRRLSPLLKAQFFPSPVVKSINILMNDCFIVKYNAECGDSSKLMQRYLPLHSDQSTHSLTIALNCKEHYVGGGTYFAALDRAVRSDKGFVSSFRGDLLHGGDPILSGTRYIIALFMVIVPVFDEKIEENNDPTIASEGKDDQNSSFSFNFFGE